MDRTIIAPYKAEEKELSEKLYKKFDALFLLHPPTDEFRKCCTNDMFLKTNQHAFFQVMHYLFRIHDPTEFKKRFYWPITDKRGESSFRSLTVEYLKHLSEKYHLNWNIKSYLVVMPGGMKFIVFLHDLVNFVVQEQVRLREKQLGSDTTTMEFSELNLKRMQKQNEFLKEYTSDYISEVDLQIENLQSKTELLKAELTAIESNCDGKKIIEEFLKSFEVSNEELYKNGFLKQSQTITSFEQSLKNLKISMETFQQKVTELRKDKESLSESLQSILPTNDVSILNAQPIIHRMLTAFVMIKPKIDDWLNNVIEHNSRFDDETITSDLKYLKTELEQIEAEILDSQKKFNLIQLKHKESICNDLALNSSMFLKYVCTPPIKLALTENSKVRLPLQDEANLESSRNYLSVTLSARKENSLCDISTDMNITLNRTKVDPVQLLRSIYSNKKSRTPQQKQTPTRLNLSKLGLKWKERQQMLFGVEPMKSLPITACNTTISKMSNTSFDDLNKQNQLDIQITSPKTPFNVHSGDITRIAMYSASFEQSPSVLLKKSTVVKKVQDASLNILNLSTSPTGRLTPLNPIEEFAAIQQNDNFISNFNTETAPSPNDENNCNFMNIACSLDEDSIFDTSDTVLKDIL